LIVHAKKTPFKVPKQAVKAKYDKNAKDTSTPLSAFTRKREVFAGRLAMSGFLAGTIGELLTGKGFLGQLSLQTNLPPVAVKGIVAAIVAFNVLTALNPLSETFSESNQRDVAKRPRGPTQNPKINPIENPTEFLGIDKGFGFTRRNEVFVGRVAMLGFASAIIGEQLTNGKGPLAQIGLGIGQPLNTELAGAGLFLWIGVFAVAAIGYGTTDDAKFLGETDGDKRIY
jgi:photosystem II protein